MSMKYDPDVMYSVPPPIKPPTVAKRKKDPDAPKRPMSAFLDYSKTFRSQVILNNPDVKDNKEISKLLGSMWRNASEHEKKPFVDKELGAREEYNEEMRQWKRSREGHGPAMVYPRPQEKIRYEGMDDAMFHDSSLKVPSIKPKRGKKDPEAPKRPMSAFLDYSKTFRSQVIHNNPHVKDNKEISKILGMLWRNASEDEKKPFVDKELHAREEYNESMRQWKKHRDEQGEHMGVGIPDGTDQLIQYASSAHQHSSGDDGAGGESSAGQYYYNPTQYGETYMS